MSNTTLTSVFIAVSLLPWTISCQTNSSQLSRKAPDLPLTTSSEEARAAVHQGLALLDVNAPLKARPFFTNAIEKDPNFSMAYLFRANASSSPKDFMDDLQAAEAHLTGASAAEKLLVDYYQTMLTGDSEKRLAICQELLLAHPDIARFQALLGEAYQLGKEVGQGRQCFQKAIALAPNWPGGYLADLRSYIFFEPKDFKKAEAQAQKLVELAPTSASAYVLLGDCFRAQNDVQKARGAYAKAIGLDPTDPVAYSKRGYANVLSGNMEEARSDFRASAQYEVGYRLLALRFEAYTWLYSNEHLKGMDRLIEIAANPEAAGLPASDYGNAKSRCLDDAFLTAFHVQATDKMAELFPLLSTALMQEFDRLEASETKTLIQSDLLWLEALIEVQRGKTELAQDKLEAMKPLLEPLKDPRKMEFYHFAQGYLFLQQKKYSDAVVEFQQSNQDWVYHQYWLAKAYEWAGEKANATRLFESIADRNYNEVGYALVRYEVKRKLAGN